MSQLEIEKFLHAFAALRSAVNSNARNMRWKAGESGRVKLLTVETYFAWLDLQNFLARTPSKGIDRVPHGLAAAYRDYEAEWLPPSGKVIETLIETALQSLDELSVASDEGEEQQFERPDFNPRTENPAKLVEDMLWLADTYAQEDSDLGDAQRKALQAWDWFRDTLGLDLGEVTKRWRRIDPVFIPEHVAGSHKTTASQPLYELLEQAVKAHVYGAPAAAIALCRALTELLLRKYYGCEGKDLEEVIQFAESQPKYHWIRKLNLQEKRRTANKVLHEGHVVTEVTVLNWLKSLKELIEHAPGTVG